MPHQPMLPPEILDAIISYVIGCTPHRVFSPMLKQEFEVRRDVLSCAHVCRAWTPVARRRLLSSYFPEGKVTIRPCSSEIFRLLDILDVPLSTLQPLFLRALEIVPRPIRAAHPESSADSDSAENQSSPRKAPLFDTLATLDPTNTSLSTLHTIAYHQTTLHTNFNHDDYLSYVLKAKHNDNTRNDPSKLLSTTGILSQIKHLEIHSAASAWFKDIIHMIRHCTSVEMVTIRGLRYEPVSHEIYPSLYPPKTLRKLNLDMNTFPEIIEWLMSCVPHHVEITSVSIFDFCWEDCFENGDVRWFFDGIGSNLEELELRVYSYCSVGRRLVPFKIDSKLDPSVSPFLKNCHLKRLVIDAELDIQCEILPYLFCQNDFAPTLEVLKIIVSDYNKEQFCLLPKLAKFDGYLHSRTSVQRLILTPDNPGNVTLDLWKDLEKLMRKYLRLAQQYNKLEFGDVPQS